MKRVSWKLPFINSSLLKWRNIKDTNKIKVLLFRNSNIPPYMIGRRVRVYNGAWLLIQTISSDVIGTKFGQYSFTKKYDAQQKSRKKSKKNLKNRKWVI